MTKKTISKLESMAIKGMFICWLGLTYSLGLDLLSIPHVDVVQIMASILDELPVFFNIKGGQPLDPTDFAKLWH